MFTQDIIYQGRLLRGLGPLTDILKAGFLFSREWYSYTWQAHYGFIIEMKLRFTNIMTNPTLPKSQAISTLYILVQIILAYSTKFSKRTFIKRIKGGLIWRKPEKFKPYSSIGYGRI